MIKIKETIERDCCHPQKDLKDYRGLIEPKGSKAKFCIHCGQIWLWDKASDGAGGMESYLREYIIKE